MSEVTVWDQVVDFPFPRNESDTAGSVDADAVGVIVRSPL